MWPEQAISSSESVFCQENGDNISHSVYPQCRQGDPERFFDTKWIKLSQEYKRKAMGLGIFSSNLHHQCSVLFSVRLDINGGKYIICWNSLYWKTFVCQVNLLNTFIKYLLYTRQALFYLWKIYQWTRQGRYLLFLVGFATLLGRVQTSSK